VRRAAVVALAAVALAGCSDHHARKGPSQKEMADEATVRLWTRALYDGHYDRAARFFAPGAVVQLSGTHVLRHHRDAVAFNRSLTCRASVLSIGHEPKGAVLATFNLGPGPGGGCTDGGRVRVRFFIHRGLIETWRQLPE
jgi:hypothetical protein